MLFRQIDFELTHNSMDLFERNSPAIWHVEPASALPDPPRQFTDCVPETVQAFHDDKGDAPPVGFACLSDTLVFGGAFVGTHDAVFGSPALDPGYAMHYLRSGRQPPSGFNLHGKEEIAVGGVSVLVHHFHAAVYGHWLLEGLPKLLLLRRYIGQLSPVRIILSKRAPLFVKAWINVLLPGVALVVYDEQNSYLRCEKLILPTLLSSPKYHFHPILNAALDRVPKIDQGYPLIYVTREKPSTYRTFLNAPEIADIARSEGFLCISPETLHLQAQVGLFANARVVAGDFGSALHNAIFSPSVTKVLALNWINYCQSRIAQLRQQTIGYIVDERGVAAHRDATKVEYRIDPERFRKYAAMLANSV